MEKRQCTRASADSTRSSPRSGKNSAELRRGEHALVDEGAARQRREVDGAVAVGAGPATSCSIRLRTKKSRRSRSMPARARRVGDEELAERRACTAQGGGAERWTGRSGRRASRATLEALLGHDRPRWRPTALAAASASAGQEGDARRRRRRRAAGRRRRRPGGSGRGPGAGCRRRRRCSTSAPGGAPVLEVAQRADGRARRCRGSRDPSCRPRTTTPQASCSKRGVVETLGDGRATEGCGLARGRLLARRLVAHRPRSTKSLSGWVDAGDDAGPTA